MKTALILILMAGAAHAQLGNARSIWGRPLCSETPTAQGPLTWDATAKCYTTAPRSVSIGSTVLCGTPVAVSGTSLTLSAAHNGCLIKFSSASSVTVTVPAGLPSGFTATLLQLGVGLVSPLASGATFTTSASTSGAGSSVFLQGVSTDTYIMLQSGSIPTVQTGNLLAGLNGNAVAASMGNFAAFLGGNLLLYSEDLNHNPPWPASNATVNNASQVTITTAASGLLYQEGITVTPGETYTFSFDVQVGTATGVEYSIRDMTNSTDLIWQVLPSYVSTATWARVHQAFVAPANCTSVRVYLIRTATGNGTMFFRRMQLTHASYEKAYFQTNGTGLVP